ncbi:MAG: toll/interleukin-1 receptor domain-containing protein, partial [Gammaproteobacteria bacterium]|nr:toll/interleukin-1 receptor domain-containing protein [Gammaproteobacteria bacterium]
LQTAIIRGEDELFPWGIGADLNPGAIVALYVPNNATLRAEERQRIRHLYSVAASGKNPIKGAKWKYLVFLYRRLTLATPLTLVELRNDRILGGYAEGSFRAAGISTIPARAKLDAKHAFWRMVITKNPELAERIKSRLLAPDKTTPKDDIAISYATEDMGFAQRLNDEFAKRKLRTFYSTTAWPLDDFAAERIVELLAAVYRNSRLGVPLLSKQYIKKPWPLLELLTILDRPDNALIVSIDGTQLRDIDINVVRWDPSMPSSYKEVLKRIERFDKSKLKTIAFENLDELEVVQERIWGQLKSLPNCR